MPTIKRFNNAGILTDSTPVLGATAGEWNEYFTGNFAAAMEIQKARLAALDQSPAAIAKRQAAVNFGKASVALEGFPISPVAEALTEHYVQGEISIEELISRINQEHLGKP